MSNNTIKPLRILAERMFPTFVAEDYPRMITFMKAVMDYMDQPGGQYDTVSHLLEYRDVDFTLQEFEDAFKKQYLRNFPDVLAADVDLLVKNIRSFYLNKGTEESFRFLFGALFQSTVNFRYPKFNVLRASDNLWYTPIFLVLTDQLNNIPPEILGGDPYDVSKLIDKFITGATTGAVAFVDDDIILGDEGLTYGGSGAVKAIQIVEGEGQFQAGEQIIIGDTIVENGNFQTGLNFWTPNYPGDVGFTAPAGTLRIEQPLGIVAPRYVSQLVEVQETTQYWIRYSLVSADSAKTRVTVGYAPGSNEVYDSGEIGVTPGPGSSTILMNATTSGVKQVYISIHNEMEYAGETCVYDGISLVKNNIQETPLLFIANIAAESGIITGESRWKDTRGFLSQGNKDQGKEIVLQDGYRYQDFSYEIKSQVSSNQFESIVRDLVHPAGFIMFADVVQADTILDRYGMREYWFNTLVFDGAQTITKDPGDGPDFDEAFRYGDVLTIEGSLFSDGTYRVQDTPDSTTLVLKPGVNLAVENLVGTPIQLQAGVGILPDGAQGESNVAYGLETLLDILNLGNAMQYASRTQVFGTNTITDSYDFTAWFSDGDEITVKGSSLNDGTYTIDTVTATTITITGTFTPETPTQWVTLALLTPLDNHNYGLRIVPADQYIGMAIEYIMRMGFGYTWASAEKNREPKLTKLGDWAQLIIGDFNSKSSSRFGFIDPWEIDVGSPWSTDPTILWGGGDSVAPIISYAVAKQYDSGYLESHVTFPGTVIPGGAVTGAKYYGTYKHQNFYSQAIDGAFGPGEYLGKYVEQSRPYTGGYAADGISVNGNTENVDNDQWFDLYNLDFMLKNYWGSQEHEELWAKVYIATDDGLGNPVPGTDAWQWVHFIADNGTLNDNYDSFTTGGYLSGRTPDVHSTTTWTAWSGNLRATSGHVTNDDDPTGTLSQSVIAGSSNNNVASAEVTFATLSYPYALIGRGIDANNYMKFQIEDTATANPVISIIRVKSGVETVLSTMTLTGVGPLDGETWTMRFAASDDVYLGSLFSATSDDPQQQYHVTASSTDFLFEMLFGIECSDNVTFTEWFEQNTSEIGRIINYPSPIVMQYVNAQRPNGIALVGVTDDGDSYAGGNLYFYENSGHGLIGPPWHSAAGSYWDEDLNTGFAMAVINADRTSFSPDEFVLKYDVLGEYGSGGSGGPLITFGNYSTGNEGVWFDAWRQNFDLEATVANPGPFETEVRFTIAVDDGAGGPLAGTEKTADLMFIRHRQGDTRTFEDLFTGTTGTAIDAHTPNVDTFGGGWVIQSGAPEIQTNRLGGTAANVNICTANTNVTDQCVWGKLGFDPGGSGDSIGFILRWTDINNYWYCHVENWETNDPVFTLTEYVAGVATPRDSVVMIGAGPLTGEDYYVVLKFYAEGNMLRGHLTLGFAGPIQGSLVAGDRYMVQYESTTGNTSTVHGARIDNNGNTIDYFRVSNAMLGLTQMDAPGFVMQVTAGSGTMQLGFNQLTSNYGAPGDVLNGNVPIDYDCTIHWGDGTYDVLTGYQSTISHTYSGAPATCPIRIEGLIGGIDLNKVSSTYRVKALNIQRWGKNKWQDLEGAFNSCSNLTCKAYDTPDLSECNSIRYIFASTAVTGINGNESVSDWNFTGTPIRSLAGVLPSTWAGNLANWDVSQIQNFTDLFRLNHGPFMSGAYSNSINNWDVSNGKYFYYMFRESNFNRDISGWNMSNAVGLDYMFFYCHEFNQEIDSWGIGPNCTSLHLAFSNARDFAPTTLNSWDVSNVTTFQDCFAECNNFNANITSWTPTSALSMNYMFGRLSGVGIFNQDISGWNVSSVTDFTGMFRGQTSFNQNISGWNVTACEDFHDMFNNCDAFNQPIGAWTINTTTPVRMDNMFYGCAIFNQPLNTWNMSQVTRVNGMFGFCPQFNSSLAGWNLSNCTNFTGMFESGIFNQPINDWTLNTTVGATIILEDMFRNNLVFDQPLSNWDVTNVIDTDAMFYGCDAFNQDLTNWTFTKLADARWMFRNTDSFQGTGVSGWDVSTCTNFSYMFQNALAFNQDISSWDIRNGIAFNGMLDGTTPFSTTNYDLLLNAWSLYDGQLSPSETLDVNAQYTIATSQAAKDILTGGTNLWTINDLGGIGTVQKAVSDSIAPVIVDTSSIPSGSTLLTDLAAWYSLDDAANVTRLDSHTNGYDLPDVNSDVGSAAALVSNGAVFGNSSNRLQAVSIASVPLLHRNDEDFTIMGFVYFNSVIPNTGIVSAYNISNGYALWTPAGTSELRWTVKSTEVHMTPSTATWYHFVAYHDSVNDEIGLIIDEGTPITAAHSTGMGADASGFAFQLGNVFNGATGFDGTLDEVCIFNRMLTGAEIAEHRNGGSGIAYPG